MTFYRTRAITPTRWARQQFHDSACHHAYRNRVSTARNADEAGRREARRLYPDQPCEKCGAIGERHHIDSNRLNNAPSNIEFLCKKHHKAAHRQSDGKVGGGPRPRVNAMRTAKAIRMTAEARRLRGQGLLIREIADRLGVHPVSVERWFRKYPETEAA